MNKSQKSMKCCHAWCTAYVLAGCNKHNSLPLGPIQPSSLSTKELHGLSHRDRDGIVLARRRRRRLIHFSFEAVCDTLNGRRKKIRPDRLRFFKDDAVSNWFSKGSFFLSNTKRISFKSCILNKFFLKMGQNRPLFLYFRSSLTLQRQIEHKFDYKW